MDIVVISGSRADRSPLKPVVEALQAEWLFLPHQAVSSPAGAALASSYAAAQTVGILQDRRSTLPDLAVILGDRHEVLGAATALNLMNIPIAHLSGGDITEGSQDNAMRHAITKLSHIHFPTNNAAARRIISMGEEEWRVFMVGCPGIDKIKITPLMPKDEFCRRLGIPEEFILVSYQPCTLIDYPIGEAQVLLDFLSISGLPCVFATVNPDAFSTQIGEMFANYAVRNNGIIFEMPQNVYLSAMKHCKYMIGNSSSGFYEAPTLKTPFINIGDRQKGRIAAQNVISCPATVNDIVAASKQAPALRSGRIINPYGDGHAADYIQAVMKNTIGTGLFSRKKLLIKQWVQNDVRSDVGSGTPGERLGIIPFGRSDSLDVPVIREVPGGTQQAPHYGSGLRPGR